MPHMTAALDQRQEEELRQAKALARGGLAAAAPGVAVLTAALLSNAFADAGWLTLSPLGGAALGVVLLAMAWLFYRGRNWAAIPAILAAAGGAVFFGAKFMRPLLLYYQANPPADLGQALSPLLILSPALVLVLVCVSVIYAVAQAMRLNKGLAARPVHLTTWGMLAVWLGVLAWEWARLNVM